MRVKRSALLLVAMVCLLPQAVRATIVPSIDISKLTEDSTLIVVGEVISVNEEQSGSFEIRGELRKAVRMVAVLRVDRVIKGKADARVSVRFYKTDDFVGFATVQADQFGMFFCGGEADDLVFVSPYYPSILASREGCARRASLNDRALAHVVTEIDCILKSPVASRRDLVTALEYFRTVPAANAIPSLKAAGPKLPSPLDVLAASILLQHNDLSMLSIVEESLQKSSKLPVQAEGSSWEFVLSAALLYIKDPAAIPALGRLMSSPDEQTRRDAAGALRKIGTEAVIAPLAKALYDEDWEVRWIAVMGIAGVAGPDEDDESWYPSHPEFKEKEQHYLDHWREWVKKKGIELKVRDRL